LTERPTLEIFSLLPLDFHSTNGEAYDTLARHLSALKNAVDRLNTNYKQMGPTPTGQSGSFRREGIYRIFPHKTTFYHLNDGQLVTFSYGEERDDGRLLFNGETERGPICIKFVRRYGKDVHVWCTTQKFAPRLLGFEALPGGWFMVVMERLDKSWVPLFELPDYPEDLRHEIHSRVTSLHRHGMVHGDIRDTNIMVKTDGGLEFMLVDYDWAGPVGQVHYPRFLNTDRELGRPVEVDALKAILPMHDILMVESL